MKILVFAGGGDIGGGKTHILSLTEKLSHNNEVKLVSFREGEFADDAMKMGIDTVVVPHTLGFFDSIKSARRLVREYHPDILHCHGTKANVMGIMSKRIYKIPVITTVHSDPKLDYMGRPLRALVLGTLNKIAHNHMDFYVAVADGMRQLLLQRGYDPFRLFTIYNGFDFSRSVEKKEKKNDEIVVGIAARFNPVKDISTLVRGFALAYKEDSRLRLKLAGEGEEEVKLRSLVKELGVNEVVEFCGWQSEMEGFYKSIDINVLSSLSETFPYSLLEGAYYYCAAIASNVGGIPYLIENDKTGYLFEAGDYKHLCDSILLLSQNDELRETLACNLRNKAQENFSLDVMAKTQESIYESAIKRFNNMNSRNAVLICGAYGKGNAGDEAVLKAILSQINDIDKDNPTYVMSRKPHQTQIDNHSRSFYIFNLFKFVKVLKNTNVYINGGGSLIQDVSSSRSLFFYLYTLKAAKKAGCKVIMYGCGIGPLLKKFDVNQAVKLINSCVDIITLRDNMSSRLLGKMGVTKPQVIITADPALSLKPADSMDVDSVFFDEDIPIGLPFICFCLRKWQTFKNFDAIVKAAEYAYHKYGLCAVFYPIEWPSDVDISSNVALKITTPYYVCKKKHSVEEAIGLLARARLVIGMRLHSLIFATAGRTPVIGISYDNKVEGFIKDMESDAMVYVEDVSFGRLKELIDKTISSDTKKIGKKIEKLCSKQEVNKVVLEDLIKK